MTLPIYSQQQVIDDFVRSHLLFEAKVSNSSSPVLRDSLSDLVRLLMRKLASSATEGQFQGAELLETSIEEVLAHLSQLVGNNTRFLDVYFPLIRERLKYTAQEMVELQAEYRKLAENVMTKIEKEFESTSSSGFNITAFGSNDDIKGFWASPISSEQTTKLDPNYLQSIGQMEGDWFPIEVLVGDIHFVIDDDGSVYVSTENFPRHLVEESYEAITRILAGAYSSAEKDATEGIDDIVDVDGPKGTRTPPPPA